MPGKESDEFRSRVGNFLGHLETYKNAVDERCKIDLQDCSKADAMIHSLEAQKVGLEESINAWSSYRTTAGFSVDKLQKARDAACKFAETAKGDALASFLRGEPDAKRKKGPSGMLSRSTLHTLTYPALICAYPAFVITHMLHLCAAPAAAETTTTEEADVDASLVQTAIGAGAQVDDELVKFLEGRTDVFTPVRTKAILTKCQEGGILLADLLRKAGKFRKGRTDDEAEDALTHWLETTVKMLAGEASALAEALLESKVCCLLPTPIYPVPLAYIPHPLHISRTRLYCQLTPIPRLAPMYPALIPYTHSYPAHRIYAAHSHISRAHRIYPALLASILHTGVYAINSHISRTIASIPYPFAYIPHSLLFLSCAHPAPFPTFPLWQ